MSYKEMLEEVRAITKGKDRCTDAVINILKKYKCIYILSQIPECANDNLAFVTINHIIQDYRYKFCEELFKELNEIPYAVVKGAVLSNRIYGESYFRTSSDIDLLIDPKNIECVIRILKKFGFVQGKAKDDTIEKFTREELVYYKIYTHQLAPFEKKTDLALSPVVNIDINFAILWGESNQIIEMEEYLSYIERRTVFGVEVKTLSPVHEFIALCLHHYKDMNSTYLIAERGVNLNHFYDIYYYLINVELDLDELNAYAEKYKVKEYVYYCIYYTNEIFKHPCLETYLLKLHTPQVCALLDYYGLTEKERAKWLFSFPERLFDVNFVERFRKSLIEDDLRKIRINRHYMGKGRELLNE